MDLPSSDAPNRAGGRSSRREKRKLHVPPMLPTLENRLPLTAPMDEEVTINFQEETTPNDIVTVIATQPLTQDEKWHRMKPGEFGLFQFGELVDCNSEQLKDVAYAPTKVLDQSPSEPLI